MNSIYALILRQKATEYDEKVKNSDSEFVKDFYRGYASAFRLIASWLDVKKG